MKLKHERILTILLVVVGLVAVPAFGQSPLLQSRLAREERERARQDSLLAARWADSLSRCVLDDDSRLSDSRPPSGEAGGDLSGSYPRPTIRRDVLLPGSPSVEGVLNVGDGLRMGSDGREAVVLADTLTLYAGRIELGVMEEISSTAHARTPPLEDSSTRVATTAFSKRLSSARIPWSNLLYVSFLNGTVLQASPHVRDVRPLGGSGGEHSLQVFEIRLHAPLDPRKVLPQLTSCAPKSSPDKNLPVLEYIWQDVPKTDRLMVAVKSAARDDDNVGFVLVGCILP